MASEFDKWFVAQFGKPVFKTPEAAQSARDEVISRRHQLAALDRELHAHDLYEEKRRAALLGWSARPSGAKGLAKTRGKR